MSRQKSKKVIQSLAPIQSSSVDAKEQVLEIQGQGTKQARQSKISKTNSTKVPPLESLKGQSSIQRASPDNEGDDYDADDFEKDDLVQMAEPKVSRKATIGSK